MAFCWWKLSALSVNRRQKEANLLSQYVDLINLYIAWTLKALTHGFLGVYNLGSFCSVTAVLQTRDFSNSLIYFCFQWISNFVVKINSWWSSKIIWDSGFCYPYCQLRSALCWALLILLTLIYVGFCIKRNIQPCQIKKPKVKQFSFGLI